MYRLSHPLNFFILILKKYRLDQSFQTYIVYMDINFVHMSTDANELRVGCTPAVRPPINFPCRGGDAQRSYSY